MVATAQFYFSSSRDKEGQADIKQAIKTAHLKHVGSIALGSFIHALTSFLRTLADIASEASQDDEEGGNKILKCLQCCCTCLDNCIEYLNKSAYAMIAISGDPYCKSAWNGFLMVLKHLYKFSFAEGLATFLIFFGQITICLLNVGTCFVFIKFAIKDSQDIDALWAPLGIIFFTTLLTTELFLSIFKESVSGTLMCLAIDLELSGGTASYGPPTFHDKLDAIQKDYNKDLDEL